MSISKAFAPVSVGGGSKAPQGEEAQRMANIERAAREIRKAEAILITCGTSFSLDSKVPDFRSDEVLWNSCPPLKNLGISYREMSTPQWGFYGNRLNMYRSTKPHEGYHILHRLLGHKPYGGFIYTSNIDGQFQKAGFSEEQIVESHGSIHHLQCTTCKTVKCKDSVWYADPQHVSVLVDNATFKARPETIPKCTCGVYARPNIQMYFDASWVTSRTVKQQDRFSRWQTRVTNSSARVCVIELGASTSVATVRYQSESVAAKTAGFLVRINTDEPEINPGGRYEGVSIKMPLVEALMAIEKRVH